MTAGIAVLALVWLAVATCPCLAQPLPSAPAHECCARTEPATTSIAGPDCVCPVVNPATLDTPTDLMLPATMAHVPATVHAHVGATDSPAAVPVVAHPSPPLILRI